jgi:hypothetical protein
MWTKRAFIIFLVINITAVISSSNSFQSGPFGSYQIVNPNSSGVKSAANFALKGIESNATDLCHTHLQIVRIVLAQAQIVAGSNYRISMIIRPTNPRCFVFHGAQFCSVLVFVPLPVYNEAKELKNFTCQNLYINFYNK